ncbi:unnamed protein product [Microthlaspi erraticum]|uniref:Retrotransposon Copia-like N-terminal domain-containing protein n=1 Tax=Microthlaspi erraticum TaxID=1685480 RepID=A0A6D2I4P9_9BRAS|nr:unnamed protein product [Microthlaspi erraticum]
MAATNENIITTDSSNLLHVNMTNVTKLTSTNFLMWSRQVQALLDGYVLGGYIDGFLVVPPATITTAEVVTPNPAYTLWQRQDKLIYSALLGAIIVSVQPLLSTTTTSAQIWDTLSSTYAKPSRGHLKQLKHQVKQWTKGARSINDYFQGFTTCFDQLALLGKPIDLEDQIEFILEGFPENYKQVVDQIEGRDSCPSLTKVHEKLLNHEAKLQTASIVPSSTAASANAAQYRGNSHSHSGQNRTPTTIKDNLATTTTIRHGNNNNSSHDLISQTHMDTRDDAKFVASVGTQILQ